MKIQKLWALFLLQFFLAIAFVFGISEAEPGSIWAYSFGALFLVMVFTLVYTANKIEAYEEELLLNNLARIPKEYQ